MDSSQVSPGTLYIVATPIGNLSDISARAVSTLSQVDKVLAEDTRHTQQLLTHLGIKNSLVSLHKFNEAQRLETVREWLEDGLSLALVSDAGTPLISDPGHILVSFLRQLGFPIKTVPGPAAFVAALSIAGMPTERFVFDGFPPAKSGHRKRYFENMSDETRTWVLYESPHRILSCLQDLVEVLGADRRLSLCRELTKTFETVISGTAAEVLRQVTQDDNQQRGEFVLIIDGTEESTVAPAVDPDKLLQLLVPHVSTKTAAQIGAELTGISKKELYQRALAVKSD